MSSYDFDADNYITLFVQGTAPGEYAMAPEGPGRPAAKVWDQCPKGRLARRIAPNLLWGWSFAPCAGWVGSLFEEQGLQGYKASLLW